MLTDRAPFDYLYLSRRLLTSLVRHDEAHRPRTQHIFGLNLRGLTLARQRRPPDYDNLHDLAVRSRDLVSDHTGDLGCWWNPYIHAEVGLLRGVFSPLMAWDGGEVACFRAEATTRDGKSVFLALFGSASNLIGYRSNRDSHGFYPSDMAGLYSLLDAVRELGDSEIDLDYRIDDQSRSEETVLDVAIDFARSGAKLGPQKVELLARVLVGTEDYEGYQGRFDVVIVGAPLWISTPRPMQSPAGIPPWK